jgi:hypothetical protein
MKVRMRYQISGTRNGEKWPAANEVLTCGDAEGEQLIAGGHADPVSGSDAKPPVAAVTPKAPAAPQAAQKAPAAASAPTRKAAEAPAPSQLDVVAPRRGRPPGSTNKPAA